MENRFETFTLLIAKINRCVKRIKMEEMLEFNLKSSHVSCLYYLYRMKSLTATNLCEICGEDKGAMSRIIDFLEKSNYVICENNLKKRYNSLIRLSEKGKIIGQKIAKKIDGILDIVSQGLNEQDREIMYKCLSLISANLEKYCQIYK